jgi:hypothetical protein
MKNDNQSKELANNQGAEESVVPIRPKLHRRRIKLT